MIKLILYFICFIFLFLSGCSTENVKKDDSLDFYELCFYFSKTPSSTSLKDIESAAKIYREYLAEKGITVLNSKHTPAKSCIFTDKMPTFTDFQGKNEENKVVEYLTKAFFNEQNSSLYSIKQQGRIVKKINDTISVSQKLSEVETISDGIEIIGFLSRTLYLANYLDNLKIENSLGINSNKEMQINIPRDFQEKWKIALFLYNTLNLDEKTDLLPGDFAISVLCEEKNGRQIVKKEGWKLEKAEKYESQNGKNILKFKSGAANLPFSEESVLKYLYSLAFSHELPFDSAFAYMPNFDNSSVFPTLYLFSTELVFSKPFLNNTSLFLWILSSERQLETYPDTLYANLLSLKIAKKLVFADKTFLGGKDLENKKSFIASEKIAETLFTAKNISVSGKLPDFIYSFDGETVFESQNTADISEISGFKALFGDPEINDHSIISFVVRNRNAGKTAENIENILKKEGFEPFQTIFEKLPDGSSWSSVSIKTEIQNEKKLSAIYEKTLKKTDKTISMGVYRVSENK